MLEFMLETKESLGLFHEVRSERLFEIRDHEYRLDEWRIKMKTRFNRASKNRFKVVEFQMLTLS